MVSKTGVKWSFPQISSMIPISYNSQQLRRIEVAKRVAPFQH
jgi:hypothetical protein